MRLCKGITGGYVALGGGGGEICLYGGKERQVWHHSTRKWFVLCRAAGYRIQGFTGLVEFVTAIERQYERCCYSQVSSVCIVVYR